MIHQTRIVKLYANYKEPQSPNKHSSHQPKMMLDRSKHFLFLAADKVRTLHYFQTIQINLICIVLHWTHLQRVIVYSAEATQNRPFPPGRGCLHYSEKIAKLKVLILILTAEISARVKIFQNPRASSS